MYEEWSYIFGSMTPILTVQTPVTDWWSRRVFACLAASGPEYSTIGGSLPALPQRSEIDQAAEVQSAVGDAQIVHSTDVFRGTQTLFPR